MFLSLMMESRKLVFDLSSIFSKAQDINKVLQGQKADHMYLPQVNIALAFDLDRYRQVLLKTLDGSVMDVKSLRTVLEEIHFNGIIVLDTGFSSHDLAEIMRMDMRFIMPLHRN